MDTRENAEELVKILAGRDFQHIGGVVLVCHPLHQRRSYLTLRRSIEQCKRLDGRRISIYNVPAGYGVYSEIPGQPRLSSHRCYLVYEILATLYFQLQGWARWRM